MVCAVSCSSHRSSSKRASLQQARNRPCYIVEVGTQGVGLCIHPLSFADWVRTPQLSDKVLQLKEFNRSKPTLRYTFLKA